VSLLLRHGADTELCNSLHQRPIDVAVEQPVIELLSQHSKHLSDDDVTVTPPTTVTDNDQVIKLVSEQSHSTSKHLADDVTVTCLSSDVTVPHLPDDVTVRPATDNHCSTTDQYTGGMKQRSDEQVEVSDVVVERDHHENVHAAADFQIFDVQEPIDLSVHKGAQLISPFTLENVAAGVLLHVVYDTRSTLSSTVTVNKCKQDAQLSQRHSTAGCVIVFTKSRRLELGDNILRTL